MKRLRDRVMIDVLHQVWWDNVRHQARFIVWDKIRRQVRLPVSTQVKDRVFDPVIIKVFDGVDKKVVHLHGRLIIHGRFSR